MEKYLEPVPSFVEKIKAMRETIITNIVLLRENLDYLGCRLADPYLLIF